MTLYLYDFTVVIKMQIIKKMLNVDNLLNIYLIPFGQNIFTSCLCRIRAIISCWRPHFIYVCSYLSNISRTYDFFTL